MTATLGCPLNTTVKCRSTECFNELELVTSNCFSHFSSGCSSDPSATTFQQQTHTQSQVISETGKLNKRFPDNQNICPSLSLHTKTKVFLSEFHKTSQQHRVIGFKTSSTNVIPNIFQKGRGSVQPTKHC